MRAAGLRVECDVREEKLGLKIRDAELKQIPYMAVCGDKEQESGSMDVRAKSRGRVGTKKIDEFIAELVDEVDRKA